MRTREGTARTRCLSSLRNRSMAGRRRGVDVAHRAHIYRGPDSWFAHGVTKLGWRLDLGNSCSGSVGLAARDRPVRPLRSGAGGRGLANNRTPRPSEVARAFDARKPKLAQAHACKRHTTERAVSLLFDGLSGCRPRPLGRRRLRRPTQEHHLQRGRNHQEHDGSDEHTGHDHHGEWSLHLTADSR